MGRNTKLMNSWRDNERLLKRYQKLVDVAWDEMNEVSALDPKNTSRTFVYNQLCTITKFLCDKLPQKIK